MSMFPSLSYHRAEREQILFKIHVKSISLTFIAIDDCRCERKTNFFLLETEWECRVRGKRCIDSDPFNDQDENEDKIIFPMKSKRKQEDEKSECDKTYFTSFVFESLATGIHNVPVAQARSGMRKMRDIMSIRKSSFHTTAQGYTAMLLLLNI